MYFKLLVILLLKWTWSTTPVYQDKKRHPEFISSISQTKEMVVFLVQFQHAAWIKPSSVKVLEVPSVYGYDENANNSFTGISIQINYC